MHGPLALGQTAVKQARDRVRAANEFTRTRSKASRTCLTSRERKAGLALCGAGYCPQKWNGSRPDVPQTGRPIPKPDFLLTAANGAGTVVFRSPVRGDHGLNCRSTYKRQTSTRQKFRRIQYYSA